MASMQAHELAYKFETLLTRRLRERKVIKPGDLARELTERLMDDVPSEAFDPRSSWDEGHVFFHGTVREKRVREVQNLILDAHYNLASNKPILLHLSSFGGGVFAGLALCSTIQHIRRQGRKVNVLISGCAMSMGSVIAQVCDYRTIEPKAWFMLHELSVSVDHSKTSIVKDEAAFLDRLEAQTFALYSERTGKPVDYWRRKMSRRDLFLTAEEALAEGLVDEIAIVPAYPRARRRKAA